MRRWMFDVLAAPGDLAPLTLQPFEAEGDRVAAGVFTAEGAEGRRAWPVVAGLPVFDRPLPADLPATAEGIGALTQRWLGDRAARAAALRRKWRRPLHDGYAAFQPFNESTRALLPLLPVIRAALRPGDVVLDTWGRTGWSGELLAALLPEQHVLSLWEGDRDVLGLAGYHHFLPEGARRENLEILFTDPRHPLPLRTGSIQVVVGLDSLHRYPAEVFPDECLRICHPDGLVLFPHVHLTNAEPTPFFERGGDKRTGRAWQAFFAPRLAGTGRTCLVMSERRLFDGQMARLEDDADTPHYNGVVALVPEALVGAPLGSAEPAWAGDGGRIVVNPLIDPTAGGAGIDRGALGGRAEALLDRHLLYRERLEARLPPALDGEDSRLLYWGERGASVGELPALTGLSAGEIRRRLLALRDAEIVQVVPVSAAMARLHTYYRTQLLHEPPEAQTLDALWRRAVAAHPDRPFLIDETDGSTFTYTDADTLTQGIGARLAAEGIGPGATLALWTDPHAEAALTFWAAARRGIRVALLDPRQAPDRAEALLRRIHPQRLFVDAPRAGRLPTHPAVVFDDATHAEGQADGFSTWLGDPEALPPAPPHTPAPGDAAVVLFTSGTTGDPKGVVLHHGALYRSSRRVAEAFDLTDHDVLLCPGSPHAMSALRNPWIATAQVGAACLVPSAASLGHFMALLEGAARQGVTVLSTTPSLLAALVAAEGRIGRRPLGALRRCLSTADTLPPALKAAAEALLGAPVADYYGLTETCGFCLAPLDAGGRAPEGALGWPVGCVAQAVDPHGHVLPVGEAGELRVASEDLMLGYLGDPAGTAEVLRGGWLYTGDRCVRRADGSFDHLGRLRGQVKDLRGDRVSLDTLRGWVEALPGVANAAPWLDGGGRLHVVITGTPEATDPTRALLRAHLGALGAEATVASTPAPSPPRGPDA